MIPMKKAPTVDVVSLVHAICYYTKKELSPLRVVNTLYLLQSATLSWYMCPLTDVAFKKVDGAGVVLESPDEELINDIVNIWCERTLPYKSASDIINETWTWHAWIAGLMRGYNRFSTRQIVNIVENTRTVSKFNNGDIITTSDIWRTLNE